MCGLAEVMISLGYRVSGSDIHNQPSLSRLRDLGAVVHLGHDAAHVADADCVVYSSAVLADNPERATAVAQGLPTVPRAQMLGELLRFRPGVAIAGTHGKTTVASMVAAVLTEAGRDPTCVIGGRLQQGRENARLGAGEFVVVEADESDASFLHLLPVIAVVTNIDNDHMEMFSYDSQLLSDTFGQFLSNLPFYGLAVVCGDDEAAVAMATALPSVRTLFYGFDKNAAVRAENARPEGAGMVFTLCTPDDNCEVELPVAGLHNVQNALAAAAVSLELGLSLEEVQKGLAVFVGVRRRLESHGELVIATKRVLLIDDYAHHPTEIDAALDALCAAYPERRRLLVFQPHRYSRTKDLFSDLVVAISKVDTLLLMEVYSAGEKPLAHADSKTLLQAVRQSGMSAVHYAPSATEVLPQLAALVREGDLLITMGAGDIGALPEKILQVDGLGAVA